MNELSDQVRAGTRSQLQNPAFLDTDVDCIGSTLGGALTPDVRVDEYWFLNLRNPVRFDRAIAAAMGRDVDMFVELAEHPTLELAIEENLATADDARARVVVGTSNRTARGLSEFSRNLALLAVHDLDYPWEALASESDGPAPLPLLDFPNAVMNEVSLWLPYDGLGTPQQCQPARAIEPEPKTEAASARLLTEKWVRLSHRSLVPPRAIGIIDHSGACADLAAAICVAAQEVGATARVLGVDDDTRADLDTTVILLPQSPELDDRAAAAEVAAFFGNRTWWRGLGDAITHCWLVTVGGEAVVADDAPPDLVHAAAAAGFRSVGAEHLGVAFRHLDLPPGHTALQGANAVVAALHTADESDLAQRNGGMYAKRIVEADAGATACGTPEHALIVGGTGHLGLEFCDHFARLGTRRITLVSRSGETAGVVADRLRQIRSATSAQIHVTSCDVGDQAAVSRLADEYRDVPADLIVHAAVDYADIAFADLTAEKVEQGLRAKVVGIWRMLGTFPRTQNARVLLCSSAAATIGGSGQVVYAAANRMLDAMAHRLRGEGLDCGSVQWGQWTVHLELDAAGEAKVAGTGIVPMSPAAALALGTLAHRGNAIVAAFDLTRARWALETYGYGPLLSQLTATTPENAAAVAGGDSPQRFLKLLAEAIGVDDADKIDTTVPLVAIGLDSLQALEFRRRVQAEFNLELAVGDLLSGASVADVLTQLS